MAAQLIPLGILFGDPARSSPAISPTGDRIAYLAPAGGASNIWVRPADRDEPVAVTHETDQPILSYSWAPDGRHVIYLHHDGDENTHLHTVDVVTGHGRDLTPFEGVQARIIKSDWRSPGAVLIGLNLRDHRLHDAYLADLVTGELTLVAENPGFSRWIADAHLRPRGAVRVDGDGGSAIMVHDGDSRWRDIHHGSLEETSGDQPVGFTADGSALYLLSAAGASTVRLVRIDVRTGIRQVAYEDPSYDVVSVSVDHVTGEPEMLSVERERRCVEPLTPAAARDIARLARVHRGDMTVLSRDRANQAWLVQYNLDDGPASYYVYNRQAGDARLLFTHMPQLEDLPLSRMEPFSFVSRDGLTIHGYLTFPPGLPRRDLPAVLTVHGGPWTRDRWGYRAEPQWLANRGYLCIQVNYRGSTGYGKEFRNAGDRQWGARMQDDLLDAVDWAVGRGYADPERLGIYGASYGGYAALLAATHTPDVFRCAIAAAAPCDLRTFLKAIPGSWQPQAARMYRRIGDPVADASLLWDRSPLSRVEHIRIPVLVAHGSRDPRVRRDEAERVVAAMRDSGVPHEYLLFQDEGHGFVKPRNRLAFYAAADRFLARHLGRRQATSPVTPIHPGISAGFVGDAEPAGKEVPGDLRPQIAGEHDAGDRHDAEYPAEAECEHAQFPAQSCPVGPAALGSPGQTAGHGAKT
jgi:dipeptidyl aminopeptidase/acylaminoacyl peptidase